jgi:hypothetical protein
VRNIVKALLFLISLPLCAQIPSGYVQTTGTVAALANGTYGAAWTNLSSSPQLGLLGCVSAFQQTVNGTFNASGHFSVLLADTAQICPTPSTWTFTFTFSCPTTSPTNGAFNIQVAVTGGGGTEDISSQMTAALPTNPCQGGGGGGGISYTAGASPVPNLLNNSLINAPDSCTSIDTAIAAGGKWILPNTLQGNKGSILCGNSVLAGANATDLGGSGFDSSQTAGAATYLTYSGNGIAVSNYYSGFAGAQFSLHDMNVTCLTSTGTTGVALGGSLTSTATGNYSNLKNLVISGCANPITANSVGNSNLDTVRVVGTTGTTGYLIDWGGTSAQNSNTFLRMNGEGEQSSDTPSVVVASQGLFMLENGNGNIIEVGDADNVCSGWGANQASQAIIHLGDYANGGLTVSGATAEVVHNEVTRCPVGILDEFSSGKFIFDGGGMASWLGPMYEFMAGAHGEIDLNNFPATQSAPFLTAVVNSTGGSLSATSCGGAGTCFLFYQAENTAATIPGTATTVDWVNTVSAAASVPIVSGTTGSVTITWPWVANAGQYNIFLGSTNNPLNAQLIATTTSGISTQSVGTYTFTGSETPTTAPAPNSVPLFTVAASSAQVCVVGPPQSYSGSTVTTARVAGQDASGTYFYAPSCGTVTVPLSGAPAVNSSAPVTSVGNMIVAVPDTGTVNGASELLFDFCSYASSAETCIWKNIFSSSFPLVFNVNDTSGINLGGTQAGVGTSHAPLLSIVASNTGFLGYPAQFTNLASAGGSITLQGTDSICSWSFTNLAEDFCHDLFLQQPVAATSGANQNSLAQSLSGTAWTGTASTGVGAQTKVLISGPGNSPVVTYQIIPTAGTGITPSGYRADESLWDLSVGNLTVVAHGTVTGSGTTATHSFSTAYSSPPVCQPAATTNAGAWYISTENTTTLTITYATSGTQSFQVECHGVGGAW